jgi:hypothetical protein
MATTIFGTSNIIRVNLGVAGLTNSTSGLIISTIAGSEATATTYTSAASNIETITTLGTYAAPTSGKCRFRVVDATNHPCIYEVQLADARFSVANSKRMIVSFSGGGLAATGVHYEIDLIGDSNASNKLIRAGIGN